MGRAQQCMYFSGVGMIFLLFVAIVFNSSAVFYVEGLESVEQGRSSVTGAFIMYCITFGASLAYVTTQRGHNDSGEEIGMVQMQPPTYTNLGERLT
ncbi:hypothetical protein TrCOL_g8395 [Triparma columacea]|uniref:Uncharacterized protein n=1 Tax=Triparma columacea TaxID=722753 RepID=A0A9W7GLQ1_9STRA|nr:hypothetical protein TrCOL_g8395 [Triparma columacea]